MHHHSIETNPRFFALFHRKLFHLTDFLHLWEVFLRKFGNEILSTMHQRRLVMRVLTDDKNVFVNLPNFVVNGGDSGFIVLPTLFFAVQGKRLNERSITRFHFNL